MMRLSQQRLQHPQSPSASMPRATRETTYLWSSSFTVVVTSPVTFRPHCLVISRLTATRQYPQRGRALSDHRHSYTRNRRQRRLSTRSPARSRHNHLLRHHRRQLGSLALPAPDKVLRSACCRGLSRRFARGTKACAPSLSRNSTPTDTRSLDSPHLRANPRLSALHPAHHRPDRTLPLLSPC